MASTSWLGNAVAVKDKWVITVANTWATNDTATVTINGKDLVVTIGANVTTAQIATTIKEAWESNTFTDTTASCIPQGGGTSIPEMSLLTATVSGSTVILLADTAGIPHTISVSESTAGSGTLSISNTVVATGPNFWDNVDNWSGGAVPSSTDDVTVDRPVSILYGLAQSAVTLTSLTFTERFTSSAYVGLLKRNAVGYEEYRATELAISATTINCRGSSGLIKLNVGTNQTTCNVYSMGTSVETGRPALQIRGTHASNVVNVYGGDVGIGASDETATVATLRQEAGTVTVGKNVTLTTVNKLSGTATIACAATTLNNYDGTMTHTSGNVTSVMNGGTFTESGSGTITTLRQTGGTSTVANTATATTVDKLAGSMTIYGSTTTVTNEGGGIVIDAGNVTTLTITNGTGQYNGTGTITTLTLSNSSQMSFDGNNQACTVTNCTIGGSSRISDRSDRVTFTNPIAWAGVLSVSPV